MNSSVSWFTTRFIYIYMYTYIYIINIMTSKSWIPIFHLVGGLEYFLFFHIFGIIINWLIFFGGVGRPPTSHPIYLRPARRCRAPRASACLAPSAAAVASRGWRGAPRGATAALRRDHRCSRGVNWRTSGMEGMFIVGSWHRDQSADSFGFFVISLIL